MKLKVLYLSFLSLDFNIQISSIVFILLTHILYSTITNNANLNG